MPRPGASIKTILRVPSARSWETDPVATMADLDELALAMPQATKELSEDGRPSYHVHGKLFCFHRGPRSRRAGGRCGRSLVDTGAEALGPGLARRAQGVGRLTALAVRSPQRIQAASGELRRTPTETETGWGREATLERCLFSGADRLRRLYVESRGNRCRSTLVGDCDNVDGAPLRACRHLEIGRA